MRGEPAGAAATTYIREHYTTVGLPAIANVLIRPPSQYVMLIIIHSSLQHFFDKVDFKIVELIFHAFQTYTSNSFITDSGVNLL